MKRGVVQVRRKGIAHALLTALAIAGDLDQRALYRHGLLFGRHTAVSMAIARLKRRGLIETSARLTPKGLEALKKARDAR